MNFTYLPREPLHFDRCWKFDDAEGISPCQVNQISLKTVDGVWVDQRITPPANANFSYKAYMETNEFYLSLLNEWDGTDFNRERFSNWLHENAINMDNPHHWRSFCETELCYYMVQIHVDDPDAPKLVDVSIFSYNRAYVTDNAMASRLTRKCHEAQFMPGYIGDLAFAKAVCEDLYDSLADAPAIKERLRSAIDRLAKMCEV